MMGYGFGWTHMWMPILALTGFAFIIVYFAKWNTGKGSEQLNANLIIAERYARGEISQLEYEKMKDVLIKK